MSVGVTRREFLAGIAVATGGTLVPEALAGVESPASSMRSITLAGAAVEFVLTRVSAATLRVSVLRASSALDPRAVFQQPDLVQRQWPEPFARLNVTHTEAEWDGRRVVLAPDPLGLTVSGANGKVVQRLAFDASTGRVSFDLHDLPVFGLGEGGHQFDRRGVVDTMRNGQFKPDQFLNGGRSPIPWLVSPAGWALYFHNPMGTFDLTGAAGVFRPSELPQAQDIFLVIDPDPAVLLREWAVLTGMPHLPPIWSLGYQQSHRTLTSRDEVLAEAKTFREKKLPCDAMIYLGTGFAPSGWNTGHGSFAFNDKIFPDPQGMFTELQGEGFRVVLHVLGAPHDLHGAVGDRSPDPDDAANYWALHRDVFRTGIDGWWVDDGDELFPAARLARNRMYWDGPLADRPNVRPFSIQRNGYAGLQRYGFLWSGDTNSQWATLRTQIADGINTGLSGIPYWGTDTGGFFSTRELTAELYVRWFQFSAFCPLFRSHGRTWKLRLPWGWNMGNVGPVEDDPAVLPAADQLHDDRVEGICRKYLELRYRLLPYTYSAVWQTHRTGLPVMRSLWLSAPGDARAMAVGDAYMWGDSLLVAPVYERGATERTVYLPRGRWYDFWTDAAVAGGDELRAATPLDVLPLFVRAGSVLPMGPVKQYATEHVDAPLEVRVYPGADGKFTLYEDDGVSMEHERGASSVIEFAWNDAERSLTVRLGEGSHIGPYTSRRMLLRVVGSDSRRAVEFAGSDAVYRL